jgi:glycosyltransferase involved in cell wall biosynthesis
MFGRLLPQKGFDSFIEAARELRHRFEDRVAFWVLGAVDQSRNESLRLLQRINEAHADGIIRYLDSTDDPLPFIREADVVVLPSTYNEGVPRSLLEALACGKPVVTTDWKGCRDTVEHEGNGLLVRPNDTASLIDALGSLATCDIGMLERLGRRSRHVAEQRFDERIVLNAYLESLSPC